MLAERMRSDIDLKKKGIALKALLVDQDSDDEDLNEELLSLNKNEVSLLSRQLRRVIQSKAKQRNMTRDFSKQITTSTTTSKVSKSQKHKLKIITKAIIMDKLFIKTFLQMITKKYASNANNLDTIKEVSKQQSSCCKKWMGFE